MMSVVVHGTKLVVTEISDQWGEESYTFIGKPALLHWAQQRFSKEHNMENKEEWDAIMQKFNGI